MRHVDGVTPGYFAGLGMSFHAGRNFTAADGYSMVTQNVAINLKTRRVAGAGGVSGTVPAGTFTADKIIGDLGERTVTLEGNARLRMTPGKMRMPE